MAAPQKSAVKSTDTPKRGGPGRPWKKGQSGNPSGRRKGSRNKITTQLENMFDGEGKRLGRKAINLAMKGNEAMLKLAIERIFPVRRDRPVRFKLGGKLQTAADAHRLSGDIVRAVSQGELTPAEATDIGNIIDTFINSTLARDMDKRLAAIEARPAK